MTFDQYILSLLGVTALLLSQSADYACRKWAPIFGLAAQPLWFWTSWVHGQMGVVILTIFYTAVWCKGVHTYWLRGGEKNPQSGCG